MTDTELLGEIDGSSPQPEISRDPDRRSLMMVLAVAVVIVVAVLLLLMLRGCGSVLNSANRRSSGNQIVPVEGGKPVDGAISVWMAAGADLRAALVSAGVRNYKVVDMGGGRFVVGVTTGTEVETARRLRDAEGVHDAGRVYEQGTAAP